MTPRKNPIDLHIGKKIQSARALSGISQQDLANALEITLGEMREYEEGGRVGAGTLFGVARILEQPIGFFYEGLPRD
jgi:transcriptional regulator with XRE-family HTH domain